MTCQNVLSEYESIIRAITPVQNPNVDLTSFSVVVLLALAIGYYLFVGRGRKSQPSMTLVILSLGIGIAVVVFVALPIAILGCLLDLELHSILVILDWVLALIAVVLLLTFSRGLKSKLAKK